MQKEEPDLRERTKEFALRIIRMFSALPKTTEGQVLGKQVLRSGTSVVHLQPFDDARVLDRFIADIQADDFFEQQHMRAAQVKVRVRRRTTMREAHIVTWGIHLVAGLGKPQPVKVRATDGGEQQRIRLRRDDAVKAWVNGHHANFQFIISKALEFPSQLLDRAGHAKCFFDNA